MAPQVHRFTDAEYNALLRLLDRELAAMQKEDERNVGFVAAQPVWVVVSTSKQADGVRTHIRGVYTSQEQAYKVRDNEMEFINRSDTAIAVAVVRTLLY